MDGEKLRLLACFESEPYEGALSPFRRFWGGMSGSEYRQYLYAQCTYGRNSKTADDIRAEVDFLLSNDDAMILAGGISAIKGDFKLLPSCCSGIEGWREWRAIRENGLSPWMGHDPDPWVDTSGPIAVLHNGVSNGIESTEVTYGEIQLALDEVESDLNGFLIGFEEWLKSEGVQNPSALTSKIDEWFQITKEYPRPDGPKAVIKIT